MKCPKCGGIRHGGLTPECPKCGSDNDCSRLPELTDSDIESITNTAYSEYRKWSRTIRGQTFTYMDGIEFWVINATLKWVSERSKNTSVK